MIVISSQPVAGSRRAAAVPAPTTPTTHFSAGPCCEGFAVMGNFGFLRGDRSLLQYRCPAFPCSETRPTSGVRRVKENKSVLS